MLVATLLPPGQSGGLDRCVDALIGGDVAAALRDRDVDAAEAALVRAMASQPLIDELRAALRGGGAACPAGSPSSSSARAAGRRARVLTAQLAREGHREEAREPVLDVMRHAAALDWTRDTSEVVMVAQLRSIALDLLQATGLPRIEALAVMRG